MWGEEEIRRVICGEREGSYLSCKLQDILLLYQGFQTYLQEKYITKEELLDVLAKIAHKSELLRRSTVILDGYTRLYPRCRTGFSGSS